MDQNAFLARERNLHGLSGTVRQQRRMVLYAHILLAAKAAAHHHRGHAHLVRRQAEHRRTFLLRLVDALIAAVNPYAFSLRHRHRALRLQERMLGRRHGIMIRDDILAVFNLLLCVAAHQMLMRKHVRPHRRVDKDFVL